MKKAGVANPIQVASDGQQAIDYLRGAGKFADRRKFPFPCLVLLDLKLPYVMGLDVLKWIREQSGMAAVVMLLTASGEDPQGRIETVAERLLPLNVPIAFEAPFGHAGRNQPVLFGAQHELDAGAGRLAIC